jgi:hypothetical protein
LGLLLSEILFIHDFSLSLDITLIRCIDIRAITIKLQKAGDVWSIVFLFDSEIELIKSLADRSTLLERAGMPS